MFINKYIEVIVTSAILLFGTGNALQAQGQRRADPSLEEELRQHLRKLDRWGIVQLLRTEKAVDEKQKKRAKSTSNPEELSLLAEDEDSGVRFYVAANRHVPLDVQLHLADDDEALVRSGIALSLDYDPLASSLQKKLKTRLALKLAADPQPIVRLSLVSNRKLPDEAYEILARDTDPVIRQKLAENIRLTRTALAILAQDSLAVIRATAASHDNMDPILLTQLSNDANSAVREAVAGNINISADILDQLADDLTVGVRLAVARHHNTRVETLKRLADDPDLDIQQSVAQHPQADRTLLLALSNFDRDLAVRQVARKRLEPVLREEIREDVLERWGAR
jgi:hypothetical protein